MLAVSRWPDGSGDSSRLIIATQLPKQGMQRVKLGQEAESQHCNRHDWTWSKPSTRKRDKRTRDFKKREKQKPKEQGGIA
jgi:hypothetical protein